MTYTRFFDHQGHHTAPRGTADKARLSEKRAGLLAGAAALLAVTATPGYAQADELADFFKDIDPDVFARYRLAVIDDDAFSTTGTLSTLQTLVGVKSGKAFGFQGYIQFRNVTTIGTDRMNTGVNGRTNLPVEIDAEATEIDQAWLAYAAPFNTTISAGRKKLEWGNQRFISKLVWRQNHTSFDGFFLDSEPIKGTKIRYTYAVNFNRAQTDDSPVGNFGGNFNLMNVEQKLGSIGSVTGYGYILNQDDAFARALSTRTFGANFNGSQAVGGGKLSYVAEYANQTDLENNPFDINEDYWRLEAGYAHSGFSSKIGVETLGGNGTRGFQTPLALLHAYNGFADQFLVTPANGLEDRYAQLGYSFGKDTPLKGVKAFIRYHEFKSETGNIDYGSEWNAQVTFPLFDKVKVLAKVAAYDADQFSRDVTKFWLQLAVSF